MAVYDTIILDIEGTACSISFVKNVLFPYFLDKIPFLLEQVEFPLDHTDRVTVTQILAKFPERYTKSKECLRTYINELVANDIKDRTLKQLQGIVWQAGYEEGEIVVDLYDDVIEALDRWKKEDKSVYIYSSGSIKAQKLLFSHVKFKSETRDLTNYIKGYYDPTSVGSKIESESYLNILKDLNKDPESAIFLSDNIKEVAASIQAGIKSLVVKRPGNTVHHDNQSFDFVDSFDNL
ncbi:enolase-phosphatase E1 [Komagataella kurtzmanii]|nr:enolase-phosphatase E1 [Komagataella kurtzmanii]